MAKDSDDRDPRKRLRKQWSPEINYPDASHPIFSKPIVMAFKNNPTPPTAEPERSSEASEGAPPPRRYPRRKPPPMKFRDASDPVYSNPTVITFVPSRSSPDSETEVGKPSPASHEDSVEKED